MLSEHGFGDGLEKRAAGPQEAVLAPPDGGQSLGGTGPPLGKAHRPRVAHDPPDAFAAVLAVDEEAFAARRQHPDAETLGSAVADIVCSLAR